jgi:enoyl-CoA hydratase
MEYKYVIVDRKEKWTEIILNRPEANNALTVTLLEELISALKGADKHETSHCIFLRGAGKSFCAGIDLKFLHAVVNGDHTEFRQLLALGPVVEETIEYMDKVVIGAVHGNAIAAGFTLSHFCDLTIATEETRFGDAHAKWGLVPGWQEPQRLARSIGARNAKRFFLTAQLVTAKEAADLGIVWKLFPEGKLNDAINEIGNMYAKLSTEALAGMKGQFTETFKSDWASVVKQDILERDNQSKLVAGCFSTDSFERMSQFVKK